MSTHTSARPCLRGCTIRRQHQPNPPEDHDPDTCTGCLPRPAEYGNLCAWDWQRLNADVIDTPALVRHLHAEAEPHAGTKPPGDGRTYNDPSEGSVVSPAITAADEIHALLAAYAHLVLEEHPDGHRMAGPDERGVWRSENTWHRNEYGTYLRPSTPAGIRDPEATARLVKWLLPQIPWCSEQPWAGEMRTEIAATVRTTMARWPTADTQQRAVPGVQCTSCARLSLVYTPTTGFRLPFHVACTNPDCGRVYTEDEYDGAIGRLAIERGYVA